MPSSSQSGHADRTRLIDKIAALQHTHARVAETVWDGLVAYEQLVLRWSATYNLIGPSARSTFFEQHVLDCLIASRIMQTSIESTTAQPVHVVDIGSGAGLPGLVGSLVMPETQFVLVDPVGKKAAFLRTAIGELALKNVQVVQDRIERLDDHWQPGVDDAVHFTSRAFTTIRELAECCTPHARSGSMLFAMKSKGHSDELNDLQRSASNHSWSLLGVHDYEIPGLDLHRNLTVLRRNEMRRDERVPGRPAE